MISLLIHFLRGDGNIIAKHSTFRIMYVKFIEPLERTESDLADCPGSGLVKNVCPWVEFKFKDLTDIDLSNAKCNE